MCAVYCCVRDSCDTIVTMADDLTKARTNRMLREWLQWNIGMLRGAAEQFLAATEKDHEPSPALWRLARNLANGGHNVAYLIRELGRHHRHGSRAHRRNRTHPELHPKH